MIFSVENVRAVLFDFDGTLADSYDAIAASVNHVRSLYNLPPLATEQVKLFVGRGLLYLLENTVPNGRPESDSLAYRAHHPSIMNANTRLLPGAAESLGAIRKSGRLAGVCSNKPSHFTGRLLDFLNLAKHMDAVFGPDSVIRAKPNPDMLLAAMKKLQVAPTETLFVGDMVVDIETARAAGAMVWVVPTGSDTLDDLNAAEPDRVLTNLHQLADCFTPLARRPK